MLEAAFLQAIAEAPDDDLSRLAYADWLEEQGDPRGEFIHVQCLLSVMGEDDPRRPELVERERELLARHQEAWLGPLHAQLCWWTFWRGFLDEVLHYGASETESVESILAEFTDTAIDFGASAADDPSR